MRAGRAAVAGLAGAAAMTALVAVFRLGGFTAMNLEMTLGTMFGAEPTPGAWALGLAFHLAMGVLFALIYAGIMDVLRRWGPGFGLYLGAVHAAVSGLMLGFLPAVHPLIPERFPAPGPYLARMGLFEAVVYIGLHLLFGYVVAGIYGPPRRVGPEPTTEEQTAARRARRPPTATLPR